MDLVAGETAAWITDRAGHTSSQSIYRDKRHARSRAERSLGTLKLLHEPIPALAGVTST
ncbi:MULTISPECIES: hypothetical protein [Sorangium]|uniref:hypothetical protein n=1 Tax=Sorangium TaxID=39643 RepID=UPI003D9C62A1